MEKLLVSISNNYLVFIVITFVIIVAIVGFLIDSKKDSVEANIKQAPIENKEEQNSADDKNKVA